MTRIARVRGRRVWDSRGRPTVEAEVELDDGVRGRGIAPAGASRGSREAVDLRDGGIRFGGFDVTRALAAVAGPLDAAVRGLDAHDQARVDAALIAADGTAQKARLGGNALVAVSLATAHAAAAAARVPLWRHVAGDQAVSLPLPQIQIVGGGAHANSRLDLQDLMVIPLRAPSFAAALETVAEVYRAAGELLAGEGRLAGVADEGGYWPCYASNEEALRLVTRAIERAGFAPGHDVGIALDCAATGLAADGRYRLALEGRTLDRDELCALWLDWIVRYPIVSIEDPFAEDDAAGWMQFARAAAGRVQIVGDDLLVTRTDLVRAAAAAATCNAALIKPNQAGTLTETLDALRAARDAGLATIVSARSGETEDTAIVHLAVGWDAGQLKVGSFARSERMSKWNEGLRIEEALGPAARFDGAARLAAHGR